MKDKVFVVSQNDGEAVAIIDMLKEAGYKEGEDLFITKQGWGASWSGLEPEIEDAIEKIALENCTKWEVSELFTNGYGGGVKKSIMYGRRDELPKHNVQSIKAFPDFSDIYGVELQGFSWCKDIDHHVYDGDDRSNSESSIEQVAKLIGVKLTNEQRFIAANDKGYIPAMEKLADEQFMTPEEKSEMIQHVRALDRAAQGITPEQEAQAERALKNIKVEGDLTTVHLPHSKCATVTDRLYGNYKDMLIVCGDGELDFYGKGAICKALQSRYEGWSGGNLEESGFWGGYADPKQVEEFIKYAERMQTETTSVRKK